MHFAKTPGLVAGLLALLLCACSTGGGPRPRTTPTPGPAPVVPQAEPEPEPIPEPEQDDPEGRFDAALRLMRTGKTQEAIDAFYELTQDFPAFSGPYTNLGLLYAERGLREPAIGALSEAVRLNPRNKVALNLLAVQYMEYGNYVRAEQTWQQALAVDPAYPAAHLNLGMLYEQHLGRPRAAIEAYRAYQRASGGDALMVDVWVAELEARLPATTTGNTAAVPPANVETRQ